MRTLDLRGGGAGASLAAGAALAPDASGAATAMGVGVGGAGDVDTGAGVGAGAWRGTRRGIASSAVHDVHAPAHRSATAACRMRDADSIARV